jgi:hypothetical protein
MIAEESFQEQVRDPEAGRQQRLQLLEVTRERVNKLAGVVIFKVPQDALAATDKPPAAMLPLLEVD